MRRTIAFTFVVALIYFFNPAPFVQAKDKALKAVFKNSAKVSKPMAQASRRVIDDAANSMQRARQEAIQQAQEQARQRAAEQAKRQAQEQARQKAESNARAALQKSNKTKDQLARTIDKLAPGKTKNEVGAAIRARELKASSAANQEKLHKQLAIQERLTNPKKGIVIAGSGSDVTFRKAQYVAKKYGGSSSDWVKMSSKQYTSPIGEKYEIHWVENIRTGARVQSKIVSTGKVEVLQ